MHLNQSSPETLSVFKRRHDDLLAHFTKAHTQLTEEVADRRFRHVGLAVGALASDASFDAQFASVDLRVRFRCEMLDDGAAVGRVSFFERLTNPVQPERLIDSATFNVAGVVDCTAEKFDREVVLQSWPFEMVLSAAEAVLRQRATEFKAG